MSGFPDFMGLQNALRLAMRSDNPYGIPHTPANEKVQPPLPRKPGKRYGNKPGQFKRVKTSKHAKLVRAARKEAVKRLATN